MNKEEKKTRKRKIDNIEDSDRPKRRRAAAKPRKQQQHQQQKQDGIPIIYYI